MLQNIESDWYSFLINIPLPNISSDVINLNLLKLTNVSKLHKIRLIIIGTNLSNLLSSSVDSLLYPTKKQIFNCLLKNRLLYKNESVSDFNHCFHNWVKQGIIFINKNIICPNEKKNNIKYEIEWEIYLIKILIKIQQQNENILFMLWGDNFENIQKCISNSSFIQSSHSSFLDCNHFIQSNSYFLKLNQIPIIWDPRINFNNFDGISINTLVAKNNNKIIKDYFYKEIFKHYFYDDMSIIAFTDGSSFKNHSGYGIVYFDNDKIEEKKCKIKNKFHTNIRAEGFAILDVLNEKCNKQNILIITDSEFWINMIYNYMPIWFNKNKSFKYFYEKKNFDISIPLFKKLIEIKKSDFRFNILHMYSHNKSNWSSHSKNSIFKISFDMNNLADSLANQARLSINFN